MKHLVLIIMALTINNIHCQVESKCERIRYYDLEYFEENFEFFNDKNKEITTLLDDIHEDLQAQWKEHEKYSKELDAKLEQNLLSQNGQTYYKTKLKKIQNKIAGLENEFAIVSEEAAHQSEIMFSAIEELSARFCLEHNIDVLLAYQKGSNITFINHKLNVSEAFCSFLNKNYSSDEK